MVLTSLVLRVSRNLLLFRTGANLHVEYMSPETVNNKSVTSATDLWALGCVFYHLLLGETPFNGGSAYLTFLKIKEGVFDIPEFLSENAKDLLRKLLVLVPENRLGAKSYADLKGW